MLTLLKALRRSVKSTTIIRRIILPLVMATILVGCQGTDGVIAGSLLLEGVPTAGELQFEFLDDSGNATGPSRSTYCDDAGEFEVPIPKETTAEKVRIVIRVTPNDTAGFPDSFELTSLPQKTVTLIRDLPAQCPLVMALTR